MDFFIAVSCIVMTAGAVHETNQNNYKPAALLLFGAVVVYIGYFGL